MPQPGGTAERTLISTAQVRQAGEGVDGTLQQGMPGRPGSARDDRIPVPEGLNVQHHRIGTIGGADATSTPGVTAMFSTRPGPPNQVSVQPPMSQIRTGAEALITTRPPSVPAYTDPAGVHPSKFTTRRVPT